MTDRALANAEKRRDEIAAEINKLNQSLDELRKSLASVENFISDWHRFADVALDSGADAGPHSREDTGRQRIIPRILAQDDATGPAHKNPDKAIVGQHAKAIIHELGRPVSRSELFTLLGLRGINLEGKEPEMVLSTMLWCTPDEEDFDFLKRNVLDSASMAEVEPSEDHVEVTLYHGYGLRPQKHGAGWIVHIEPGISQPGELTRSPITFATLEGALDEAKKIVMKDLVGAARLRRF
jgi:hypothetical protein